VKKINFILMGIIFSIYIIIMLKRPPLLQIENPDDLPAYKPNKTSNDKIRADLVQAILDNFNENQQDYIRIKDIFTNLLKRDTENRTNPKIKQIINVIIDLYVNKELDSLNQVDLFNHMFETLDFLKKIQTEIEEKTDSFNSGQYLIDLKGEYLKLFKFIREEVNNSGLEKQQKSNVWWSSFFDHTKGGKKKSKKTKTKKTKSKPKRHRKTRR